MIHAASWMDLKGVMLSEKSVLEGYTMYDFTYWTVMIPLVQHSQKDEIIGMGKRSVVARGCRGLQG